MTTIKVLGAVNNLSGEYKWNVNISPRVSKSLVYRTELRSPEFSIYLNNKETFWHLILYKDASCKHMKSRLATCLENLSDFEEDISCQFYGTFCFKGTKISENMGNSVLKADNSRGSIKYLWTTDEHEIDQLKHFSIYCSIKVKNDKVNQISNQNVLSQVYESLFTNERLSDVTVVAGGRKFFLHKCILANRSSVFEKMFETDMVEKQKNIINIPDFDPEILNVFFKYLYTNKIENLSQTANDLLCVAEKYLVMELKSLCENSMCDNINIDNAIEYLKQAEMYNLETLKRHTVKYIAKNMKCFKHLKTSDDDSCLESLPPNLLVDILNRMSVS